MRILIDTNIFIPLEDSSINIDDKISELNRIVSGKHELLLHPATIEDINRDTNEDRKQRTLARVAKYTKLEAPPIFDSGEEEALLGSAPKNNNDKIDNLILFALHKNCCHLLITEDSGLQKKAKLLGLEERTLTVAQAIAVLKDIDSTELKLYPNIFEVLCHELKLNNPFFDSLRSAYDGFDNWFKGCAQAGRRAWISGDVNNIDAICIYKQEADPIVTQESKGLSGKVIKLCTFKVVKLGYKIGELLLKQAFNYAVDNNIDYIYVTVEPDKHNMLVALYTEFGFYYFGVDRKGRDYVYVKEFYRVPPSSDLSPLDYAIKYYPLLKLSINSVYLIPIQPRYHEILFPELKKQSDLFDENTASAGNAIKQAYISTANIKSILPGDIIFFYRSGDEMAITTYGVVDQFHIESDSDKILQWVSKRTVYSQEDIKDMNGKEVRVILFRLVAHLKEFLSFEYLKNKGIVNGSIQSITTLPKDRAHKLITEAKIHDRILSG